MEWPILTRRVLAVPIKGAAAVSCARLLLAGFCFCVPVPWAVTLGLCGSLGMVLTHFINHLNRMGGMTIDGYTFNIAIAWCCLSISADTGTIDIFHIRIMALYPHTRGNIGMRTAERGPLMIDPALPLLLVVPPPECANVGSCAY